MPDSLQQHLESNVATDKKQLASAAEVAHKAEEFHAEAQGSAPVTEEAVRYGNAMRISELGEAVKNLVNNGTLKKDTVLCRIDGHNVTAEDIMDMRDSVAHPERMTGTDELDFSQQYAKREAIAEKIREMGAKNPNDTNVRSALDALDHLSGEGHVSPTAARDAENYMQMERGGLIGNISHAGQGVIDEDANGQATHIIARRNDLAHRYMESAGKPDTPVGSEAALQGSTHYLNADNYRAELLGTRTEPALEAIVLKWDNQASADKGLDGYNSYSRDMVIDKISDLAKSGAKVEDIQALSDVLIHGRQLDGVQMNKYMAEHYPNGVSETVKESLRHLDEDAKADGAMKGTPAQDQFANILQKTEDAEKYTKSLKDPNVVARNELRDTLNGPEVAVKNTNGFVTQSLKNHGYSTDQINTIAGEIDKGLAALSNPHGLQSDQIAKLSPETREVLTDIVNGIKKNDPKLFNLKEGRDAIIRNTEHLGPEGFNTVQPSQGNGNGARHDAPGNGAAKTNGNGNGHSNDNGNAAADHEIPGQQTPSAGQQPQPAQQAQRKPTPSQEEIDRQRAQQAERTGTPPAKDAPGNETKAPVQSGGKPTSALNGALGTAASGYITYSGIVQAGHGVGELSQGHTLQGSGDLALGTLNTATGVAGGMEAVAPGTIEKIAGRTIATNFERAVPVLMGVQAGFEVLTAPDGKKGEAAVRAGVPMGASLAAGAMAGGGAAGFLLPIGVGVAAGLAIDRAYTMHDLNEKHDKLMNEMKPDNAHTHLQLEADKLQNTLVMAQFGDQLAKGKDGKIDLESQANLDKIKASMPEKDQQSLASTSAKQADQDIEQMRQQGIQMSASAGGMGMDPFAFYSEKQMNDLKEKLTQSHEKENLQLMAAQMQLATEARKDYFPPDAKLALDASGKIDLHNAENLETMKTVLNREHDAAVKGTADTERSTYYWNFINGEKTLREHIAQEEMRKLSDTAMAELNQAQWGAVPGSKVERTPEQSQVDIKALKTKADAMAKANGGKQNVETDFTYRADNHDGRVNAPTAADDRNEKLPPEVLAAYQKIFSANQGNVKDVEIDQVIYKDDGQGHKVPDKLVVWHIIDPEAKKQVEAAVSGTKQSITYDGDHGAIGAKVQPTPAGTSVSTPPQR